MEQTRTISAMKNHIQELEEKLDNLQKKGDINDHDDSSSEGIAVSNGNEDENMENSKRKSPNEKKRSEDKTEVPTAETLRISDGTTKELGDISESGEEIFVYIDKEHDPLNLVVGKGQSSMIEVDESEVNGEESRISYEADDENNSDIEIRLDSGLASDIVDEITSNDLDVHKSTKKNFESPGDDSHPKNDECIYELHTHNVDEMKYECRFPEPKETKLQSNEYEVLSATSDTETTSNKFVSLESDEKADSDEIYVWRSDTCKNDEISAPSHARNGCDHTAEIQEKIDTPTLTERNASVIDETKDSFISDEKLALEEINAELKERVSVLEEQLWLAAEERRNMQAILELQKERALKNLAFKFEDINRKTLREFKGIFEYRLQELNEEKMKLQEKLDTHQCTQSIIEYSCEECMLLKERLAESEEKCAKLLGENNILKRRCRKLSGDLGKVKNVISSLAVNGYVGGIDVSSQTDIWHVKRIEIGIQCELSPDTSLNDLHDEVRDIATKISVISSCLSTEQRQNSQGEDSFADNDVLNSVSSNNESGIESLQISPTKSGTDHEDSDIGDYNSVSFGENSVRSDPTTITEFFSKSEKQFPLQVDEIDSIVLNDSDIQLSIYEIEKPLLRIHAKYMKISEELENIATGKFSLHAKTTSEKAINGIGKVELDPEIKKIVEEVNRKYDEYFGTESGLWKDKIVQIDNKIEGSIRSDL